MEEEVGAEQLIVVVCVRGDDPLCGKVENAAEIANRILLHRAGGAGRGEGNGEFTTNNNNTTNGGHQKEAFSSTEPYQIVRVDFGECRAAADSYGVRSLPAFLMFHGGRLAWAGTLGGIPVKSAPPEVEASRRRVLLVEPCAKVRGSVYCAINCTSDLSPPEDLFTL